MESLSIQAFLLFFPEYFPYMGLYQPHVFPLPFSSLFSSMGFMSDQPQSPSAKKRILIVDDDVYNRDFYKELLLDAGYLVETAANGDECIARLQSDEPYDLILLDIVMPVKDGLQTLKELQDKDFRKKHGQIYMLSALGQDSVLAEAKEHGSQGFIVKTDVTPEQFLKHVADAVHANTSTPITS